MTEFSRALSKIVDLVGGRKALVGKPPNRVNKGDLSEFLSGARVPGPTVMLRICELASAHDEARALVAGLLAAWQRARVAEGAEMVERLAARLKLPPADGESEPPIEDDLSLAFRGAADVVRDDQDKRVDLGLILTTVAKRPEHVRTAAKILVALVEEGRDAAAPLATPDRPHKTAGGQRP